MVGVYQEGYAGQFRCYKLDEKECIVLQLIVDATPKPATIFNIGKVPTSKACTLYVFLDQFRKSYIKEGSVSFSIFMQRKRPASLSL